MGGIVCTQLTTKSKQKDTFDSNEIAYFYISLVFFFSQRRLDYAMNNTVMFYVFEIEYALVALHIM